MSWATSAVFRQLVRREFTERHQGSFLGLVWLLLLPLLQLAVLAVVFGALLPARASLDVPYPAFLAIGMWPWLMMANSINRSVTAYTDNRDLIGKVAIHYQLYVLARVTGSLIIDLSGWLLVLFALYLYGIKFSFSGLLLCIPAVVVMIIYAVSLSNIVAILQVFVRDFAPAVVQLLTLGFFLTPILYVRSAMPAEISYYLGFNPFALLIEWIHAALLNVTKLDISSFMISAAVATLLLLLSIWLNKRARPHIEDFL